MSVQESTAQPPQPAVSQVGEIPGAFPRDSDFSEDAQLSSDLNSLSRAVRARRAEYTRRQKLRVRVGSWNVATLPGTEEDVGKWFTDNTTLQESSTADGPSSQSEERVDLYVLGLQEVVDVSSPSEALRPYVDPAPSNRWKAALETALPPGYELVSSHQLMGLLLLIYAAPSIAPSISSVSSSSVGTGLLGYMGNKGAVATRIVLGGMTRVVFLNCHLAAGADKASFDRRNWDAGQILSRIKFDPVDADDDISDQADLTLVQGDFAFWFGDLNYRLDNIPGDDVRRLLHLHTENRFRPSGEPSSSAGKENVHAPAGPDDENDHISSDVESDADITLVDNDMEPKLDPASLQTTLASLLPHDQLGSLQKTGKAFHEGWREGPIGFLPTYKYDVGLIGKFDSSEKQRSPSWCDRILYRTRHDHSEYLQEIREGEEAKKRDEEMKRLGLDQEADDDGVLFDYDPESDGARDTGVYDENENGVNGIDTVAQTTEETATLIGYNSHQNIVSSDHKPIHADFVLVYEAVDPDLKAKIHQEVVRELDRAENEARPDITVAVDQPSSTKAQAGEAKSTGKGARNQDTVDFGQVRYDVPVSRGLTLANTGGVSATFSFHHRPNDKEDHQAEKASSPSWLQVRVERDPDHDQKDGQNANTPPKYTLSTGDSVQVQFVLCISDINFVRDLNRGKTDIEDILVLRVTNGRDQFLSVRGEWQPTCFGLSLLELTRIPEGGVRQLDEKTRLSRLRNEDGERGNGDARMSAPHELFRLTEAVAELTERSVAEWGMTGGDDSENETCPWMSERTGWPFDKDTWKYEQGKERQSYFASIREALDTGASFSAQFPPELPARFRVELLAETLLSFLRYLEDGLITEQLWKQLEQQILAHEKLKRGSQAANPQSWILDTLSSSPLHSVSFTFLTFMLNRVANEIAPVPAAPPSAVESDHPTTPSIPRSNTTGSVSSSSEQQPTTTPSSPTTTATTASSSSLPFPFRFKSRSRAVSSSGGSEADTPRIPTSAPTTATTPTTATATPNPATTTTTGAGMAAPGKASAALLHRQAVNKSFAGVFVEVTFSSAIARPEKEKERRAWEERKRGLLEPFLNVE